MNVKLPEARPITLRQLEDAIKDARAKGATDETRLYGSAGSPGEEILLQPLTAAGTWNVAGSDGSAFCIRGAEYGTTFDPKRGAVVLTIGAKPAAFWAIRFNDAPDTVFFLPANGAADFLDVQPNRAFLVPPVPLTSYMDMTLYIGRDEMDKETPELRRVIVPAPPYDDPQTGPRYMLTGNGARLMAVYQRIRDEHGILLWGQGQ